MTNADIIRLAESAAQARAFVKHGDLLFDTAAQRDAAANALAAAGVPVERTSAKVPGRPIRKYAVRLIHGAVTA
jgi:ribosomal protein S4